MLREYRCDVGVRFESRQAFSVTLRSLMWYFIVASLLSGLVGSGVRHHRQCESFAAIAGVSIAGITVGLGATLQQEIDSGAMTAEDLKKQGAFFNWEVSGKNASGYCNVDGAGNITEFKQF